MLSGWLKHGGQRNHQRIGEDQTSLLGMFNSAAILRFWVLNRDQESLAEQGVIRVWRCHSCRCLPLIESIEVFSFVGRRDGVGGNLGEGFRSDWAIPVWRLVRTRFSRGWWSRDKMLLQYGAIRAQSLQSLHPLDCGSGSSRSDVWRLFWPISRPLRG